MSDLTTHSGQAEGGKTPPSALYIRVDRFLLEEKKTFGNMYVQNQFFCHTLEDPVREIGPNGEGKVYGDTAIPTGCYPVVIGWSGRFKRNMIRVNDVPHFTGILIHGGNTVADTHGCILVGMTLEGNGIKPGTSTPAIQKLFAMVQAAIDDGRAVWLTVV